MATRYPPLAERFQARFVPDPNTGCWLWLGCLTPGGYGQIKAGGRLRMAHRVSYWLAHGELLDSADVLHSCHQPSCVNPSHLRMGTPAENMADKMRAGRWRGNAGGTNRVLDEVMVRAIWIARGHGRKRAQLASMFGCSIHNVDAILQGRSWGHVRRVGHGRAARPEFRRLEARR